VLECFVCVERALIKIHRCWFGSDGKRELKVVSVCFSQHLSPTPLSKVHLRLGIILRSYEWTRWKLYRTVKIFVSRKKTRFCICICIRSKILCQCYLMSDAVHLLSVPWVSLRVPDGPSCDSFMALLVAIAPIQWHRRHLCMLAFPSLCCPNARLYVLPVQCICRITW